MYFSKYHIILANIIQQLFVNILWIYTIYLHLAYAISNQQFLVDPYQIQKYTVYALLMNLLSAEEDMHLYFESCGRWLIAVFILDCRLNDNNHSFVNMFYKRYLYFNIYKYNVNILSLKIHVLYYKIYM